LLTGLNEVIAILGGFLGVNCHREDAMRPTEFEQEKKKTNK
jgi:hypothetical protein